MKSIFKLFFASGFLLLLNSCVPIQELDESYNQMDPTYISTPPILNPPPINRITNNPFYYRTPDGGAYLENEYYRDRAGKLYFNGYVIGQDNVFEHPGVIGKKETQNTVNSMGFLPPPVDFDDPLQNNMSKTNNSNGISTKRSGANSNTYDGKFHNTNRK